MLQWTVHLNHVPNRVCLDVVVAVRNKLYFFGVNEDSDHVDVFVFNTVSLVWRELTPATSGRERHLEVSSKRTGHTGVLVGDNVYIWGGGKYGHFCNVLYAFDVDAHIWFKPRVSGTVPRRRRGHSACVLGKVMFIHGGEARLIDIYKLDTATMVWSLINARGTPPPAAYGHSATIIGTKMFVFGGIVNQLNTYGTLTHRNILRVFDTETNHWLNTPSARLLPE